MAKGLKISALVEETGVSRETIRFYLNEGLLPEPTRTARNMAWYGPEHVERLRLIKALQEEQFLPLKAIRAYVRGTGEAVFSPQQLRAFDVMRERLRNAASVAAAGAVDLAALQADLAIGPDELAQAVEGGHVTVLARDGRALVTPEDAALLRLWARARDAGLSLARGFGPRDLGILVQAVDRLFAEERRLIIARMRDVSPAEALAVLDQILPAVNEVIAILHARRLRSFIEDPAADLGERHASNDI